MTDLSRLQGFHRIGDGVFARFDGYHIWVQAVHTDDTTHLIALEPEVLGNLVQYVSELRKRFPAAPVPVWEALRRTVKREDMRTDLPRRE